MSLFKKSSISLGLALAGVVMTPAKAGYIYGMGSDNKIIEVDTLNKTSNSVYDASSVVKADNLPGNQAIQPIPNAFAYDRDVDRLFFFEGDPQSGKPIYDTINKRLYVWDRLNQPVKVEATSQQLGLEENEPMPQNAAFFGGAIWYFHDFTRTLHKVTLDFQVPGKPKFAKLDTFEISGGLPLALNNGFGDIAINFNTGMLYATTSKPQDCGTCTSTTYRINLNQLTPSVAGQPGTGTAVLIRSSVNMNPDPNALGTGLQAFEANKTVYQIAFDENFIDLWAHQNNITSTAFGSGIDATSNWGTLDVGYGEVGDIDYIAGTGLLTGSAGFVTLITENGKKAGLRDIAGSAGSSFNDPVTVKPPRANDDQFYTLIDTPITNTVATNDTNPYPNTCSPGLYSLTTSTSPLITTIGTTTQGGTVTALNPCTGTFTYQPPVGFPGGTDTFTYKICLPEPQFTQAADQEPPVAQCDDAVVTITIANTECKFSTLTQGGWSNKAHKNLLEGIMKSNADVKIGFTPGKSYTFLAVNGPDNIQRFLPSSGTPRVLEATRIDPVKDKASSNTFAGQLLTMTLNVLANPGLNWAQFDQNKLSAAMKAYFNQYNIRNVNDLIARANLVISDIGMKKDEISFLTGALEAVTLSWHEGVQSSGSILNCPNSR